MGGAGAGVAGGLLGRLTSLSPPLSRQFMASSGLAATGTAALASQWSSWCSRFWTATKPSHLPGLTTASAQAPWVRVRGGAQGADRGADRGTDRGTARATERQTREQGGRETGGHWEPNGDKLGTVCVWTRSFHCVKLRVNVHSSELT